MEHITSRLNAIYRAYLRQVNSPFFQYDLCSKTSFKAKQLQHESEYS